MHDFFGKSVSAWNILLWREETAMDIIFYPQYPIFILIWGMIMLIPIALLCRKGQNSILKVAKLA